MPDDPVGKLALGDLTRGALDPCDFQGGILICSAARRKRVRAALPARGTYCRQVENKGDTEFGSPSNPTAKSLRKMQLGGIATAYTV